MKTIIVWSLTWIFGVALLLAVMWIIYIAVSFARLLQII